MPDQEKAIACAQAFGLGFHLETFYPVWEATCADVVPHTGDDFDRREASEEELEMWRALMGIFVNESDANSI